MKVLLNEVSEKRHQIKTDRMQLSLSEIVRMYNDGEIVIRPAYQRLFRWTREQQSNFIESLILEIPIQPLFFFELSDGRWELIDGLQRISTIIRFLGATTQILEEFSGAKNNEEEWHYDNQFVLDIPLQLLAGKYIREMVGMSFKTLPTPLQLNLKRWRLDANILKRETEETYKYEVFKRLNTGGSSLSDQEVRNCGIRMLDDRFPDFLQDISKDENFTRVLGLDDSKIRLGAGEEFAARFFCMKNDIASFIHDVSNFITTYMEKISRNEVQFGYVVEEDLFKSTFALLDKVCDDGTAFRGVGGDGKPKGGFSPALFEIISTGIASNLPRLQGKNPAQILEAINRLKRSQQRYDVTGSGSNSRKKTTGRIELGKEWFSSNPL